MNKITLRKGVGFLLQIIGAVVLPGIAVIAFFALRFARIGKIEIYEYLLIGLAVIILFVIGSILFNAGKAFQIPPVNELRAQDTRPIVLYLRSFEFDSISAQNHAAPVPMPDPVMGAVVSTLTKKTYEETLAKVLNKVGPCIAVGEPGKEAPILGFSREQLPMEGWQEKVRQRMREAALVVICSGNTKGVLWELNQAKEIVPPGRLVILITRDTSREWWESARSIFGEKLPKFPKYPPYQEQAVHGLIYFDENGIPRDEVLAPFNNRILREKLSPVFKRLGAEDLAPATLQ